MLLRLFRDGGDIELFSSHPPGDLIYREDLMQAALGEIKIEAGEREYRFRIVYANTFEEPVGGLMNVMLAEDGRSYAHSEINNGRTLVIDIGGHTTDWLAVNPGGEVDYSLAQSTPHRHPTGDQGIRAQLPGQLPGRHQRNHNTAP